MNVGAVRNRFAHLVSEYQEHGFVVVRDFMDPKVLNELQDELDRYIREVVPTLSPERAFYQDRSRPETLKQLNSLENDTYFDAFRQCSDWRDLAATLLEEEVVPKQPQWFNKPPGTEHPTPPHQDNYYFCLTPNTSITLWLALDPIDQENGCLRYLPGSHRHGIQEHGASRVLGFSQGIEHYGAKEIAREVEICCQPGDLLAHHGETIHRADPNRSRDRHRRAFAVVYYTESAVRDEVAYQAYQARLDRQHQTMGIKETEQ